MSFGSNGWIGCVRFKKINCNFFRSTSGQNGPRGWVFGTSFVDRNRNCENTPDMSFGSNGLDWVHSIQKNQLQLFSLHKWLERPSGSGFARVLLIETETAKTHVT